MTDDGGSVMDGSELRPTARLKSPSPLGKCLDANGGTANETAVDLYNCNNTGVQVFIPHSDKCLDNTNWSTIREPRCRSGPAQATPARSEPAVTRHGTARACSRARAETGASLSSPPFAGHVPCFAAPRSMVRLEC